MGGKQSQSEPEQVVEPAENVLVVERPENVWDIKYTVNEELERKAARQAALQAMKEEQQFRISMFHMDGVCDAVRRQVARRLSLVAMKEEQGRRVTLHNMQKVFASLRQETLVGGEASRSDRATTTRAQVLLDLCRRPTQQKIWNMLLDIRARYNKDLALAMMDREKERRCLTAQYALVLDQLVLQCAADGSDDLLPQATTKHSVWLRISRVHHELLQRAARMALLRARKTAQDERSVRHAMGVVMRQLLRREVLLDCDVEQRRRISHRRGRLPSISRTRDALLQEVVRVNVQREVLHMMDMEQENRVLAAQWRTIQTDLVRHVAAGQANADMDEEQAQRITQDKMASVMSQLLREASVKKIVAAMDEEQAERVNMDKMAHVMCQLLRRASVKQIIAAVDDEQAQQITKTKMATVMSQLLHEAIAKPLPATDAARDRKSETLSVLVRRSSQHQALRDMTAEQQRRIVQAKYQRVAEQVVRHVAQRWADAAADVERQERVTAANMQMVVWDLEHHLGEAGHEQISRRISHMRAAGLWTELVQLLSVQNRVAAEHVHHARALSSPC